jgi:hypothetical protein
MNKKLTKIKFGLSLLVILALTAFTADKVYTLKFSEEALNKHFNNLSAIKAVVEKSNLPHQEVVFVLNSIDSLQKSILEQVKAQSETVAPKK